MSTDYVHDQGRVNAVQGLAVTTPDGRKGRVVNSYVLGDTLSVLVRVGDHGTNIGTTLWLDEKELTI